MFEKLTYHVENLRVCSVKEGHILNASMDRFFLSLQDNDFVPINIAERGTYVPRMTSP